MSPVHKPRSIPDSLSASDRQATRKLLTWYRANKRKLPWRENANPYYVWISETMLQQTRVATVIPYFENFIQRFPTVASLARAKEEDLLTLWSGLGYYSRVRNLQRAAREIMEVHDGNLPVDPAQLLALPGVGRYTQGALLSIAFGRTWPVVDGNVARVLSRWFVLDGAPESSRQQQELWQLAATLVPRSAPGDHNQALMELGATICTSVSPRCSSCPLRSACRANQSGRAAEFPLRKRRAATERVRIHAAWIEWGGHVFLRQTVTGANKGLLDLPADQTPHNGAATLNFSARGAQPSGLLAVLESYDITPRELVRLGSFRHAIMNRNYEVELFQGRSGRRRTVDESRWVSTRDLDDSPLTARVRKARKLVENLRSAVKAS